MRKPSALVLLLGAAIASTVACDVESRIDQGGSPGTPVSGVVPGSEMGSLDAGLLSFPGFASFGHEVRAFRSCGSGKSLWAIDSSGVLWDLHQELTRRQDPYEELFVVLEGMEGPPPEDGFGAAYAGTFVVEEIRYAALEGFGCDLDWSGFSFRAVGNEPFWVVEASPKGIEFARLGGETKFWDQTQEERTEAGVFLVGWGPEGSTIQVDLLKEPCRDSMSGAFFGFTAMVRVEGEELTGCAVQGGYHRGDLTPG